VTKDFFEDKTSLNPCPYYIIILKLSTNQKLDFHKTNW